MGTETKGAGGRAALITGATSGIGRDTAFLMAERGFSVLASGRNGAKLEDLRAEARSRGLSIETLLLDVCDGATILAARERACALTGGRGVDVLINNAGRVQLGPTSEVSDADVRAQFETNVFGLLSVTRAFAPAMIARRSGRIINVGSISGVVTFPFLGVYAASKYAVEALSDALRMELSPFGIDVVVVEPGLIRTGLDERAARSLSRYNTASSPFAPALARREKNRRRLDGWFEPVGNCSRAILDAATARRPRPRYVVTRHAKLILLSRALLPRAAFERAVALAFGLPAREP
jgi:short-subunit dehydrogenase